MTDMILLDTNLISEAQRPKPRAEVKQFFEQLETSRIALPFTTIFEIEYGIRKRQANDPFWAENMLQWFSSLLQHPFNYLDLNVEVARLYGRMAALPPLAHFWRLEPAYLGPKNRDQKLKFGCDVLLSALSIVHRIPIATIDIKDFMLIDRYFPLPGLYDPVNDIWPIFPCIGWSFQTNANDDRPGQTTAPVLQFRKAL